MEKLTTNCVVSQRIEITEHLIKLRVVPDSWELPDFTPGQYSVLGLPGSAPRHPLASDEEPPLKDMGKMIRRAYSVASSSVNKQHVEFYVGLVHSGALSPRLFALKVGDPVYMAPKFKGMFTLAEVPVGCNALLVATGTGVAPYMSMLRTEVQKGLRQHLAVIHGAYQSRDLGYHSELSLLGSMSDKFVYVPVLSHAHEDRVAWTGYEGFVQKVWEDRVLDENWGFRPAPDNTHVFLCGNPYMIDDMKKLLESDGFKEHTRKQPGEIHCEQYFVKL